MTEHESENVTCEICKEVMNFRGYGNHLSHHHRESALKKLGLTSEEWEALNWKSEDSSAWYA